MPKVQPTQPSLFRQHVATWHDCQRCPLHLTRNRIVLARGTVPCDVLFIGEAPGESENVMGVPFVGPAGHLLDSIIGRALNLPMMATGVYGLHTVLGKGALTFALTNLISCIPYEQDGPRRKAGEPDEDSIRACLPRLLDFIAIAKPRLVVGVGRLAEDWLKQGFKWSIKLPAGVKQVAIVHPAAILRAPSAQQSLMVQRCVVTIANAVEGL